MRRTRNDVVATAAVGAGILLYVWHRAAPDAAVVGSARLSAAALLVLAVTACAVAAEDLKGVYARVMSMLGAIGVVLSLACVVSGSERLLTGLVWLVGGMWLVTTARHAVNRLSWHDRTGELVER